jgi:peptide/nickel transport system permease protein
MAETAARRKNKAVLDAVGVSEMVLIWRQYKKNKGAILGLAMIILLFVVAVVSPFIWSYADISNMNVMQRLQPPSAAHPFGTDHMGRDVFARICYGTQYSIMIGFLSVAISTIFGVSLGAVAGYYGGKIETAIMRIVELFLMVPSLLLAIVIVAAFGINLTNLIIALGVTTIPHFARNARAAVMTVCGNEYVEAARAIGANDLKIIILHVIPNVLSPVLIQSTTRIGGCIVQAASFSFLGLGVPVPTPEWGAMLSDARSYMRDYPNLIIFPGLAIFITVLSINLIGDGLRDALDPKLKR